MRSMVFGVLVVATLAAEPATPAQAPSPESRITSATARVVRKPVPVVFADVQNLRSTPMVEWELFVGTPGGGGQTSYTRRDSYGASWGPGDGPVAPNETRRMRFVDEVSVAGMTATLTLGVFADGFVDGTPAKVSEFLKRKDALAEDLAYWQIVLGTMPRTPQSEAFAFLRAKADERQRINPDDPSQIRNTVRQWIAVERPTFWTFGPVDALKKEIEVRLADAKRPRAYAAAHPQASDATHAMSPSVAVRFESGQGEDFVVRIENLKDTPLEAWQLDIYASPKEIGPGGGRSSDACVSLDEPSGRVKRGVPLEQPLSPADGVPADREPAVVLRLAVWQDLTFEGPKTKYDELLRERERRAEGYAFWIAALREASGKSLKKAVTLLRAKREAQRRDRPGESDVLGSNLTNWERTAAATPDAPAPWLDVFRAHLEQQRALLLRHQAKR